MISQKFNLDFFLPLRILKTAVSFKPCLFFSACSEKEDSTHAYSQAQGGIWVSICPVVIFCLDCTLKAIHVFMSDPKPEGESHTSFKN